MKITPTGFDGLLIVDPIVIPDNRGHFFESFNRRTYKEIGLPFDFVQENQSRSKKNVIRGLHFQKNPHAQSKLISVLQGRILDVVVDLRQDKPTFKKYYAIELSSESLRRLFVPRGFAHGFSVLSESADVIYHCDEYYDPVSESGILFNDPDLAINWGIKVEDQVVSNKDLKLPPLRSNEYAF